MTEELTPCDYPGCPDEGIVLVTDNEGEDYMYCEKHGEKMATVFGLVKAFRKHR